MLDMQELSLPPLQWTPDLDMNGQGTWDFPVSLDPNQQHEQPGAEFEFHGPRAEFLLGHAACADLDSTPLSINWSLGIDDDATTPMRSSLEGFAWSGEENEEGEEGEEEVQKEEDSVPDIIFDTCFGLVSGNQSGIVEWVGLTCLSSFSLRNSSSATNFSRTRRVGRSHLSVTANSSSFGT